MSRSTLRPLAVLLAALALLAVIAVATAGVTSSDQQDPSSRSAGRLGTLALYTWLHDLGLPVHRISGSFDLAGTDVLVLYDPTVTLSSNDAASVISLLRSGGDAIVVLDLSSLTDVEPLLSTLGVQVDRPVAAGVAAPAQPYDSTGRVRTVPVSAGYAFSPLPQTVPLLRAGGDVVATAVRPGGGGRAYVVGDTQPFSNDGLRHGDSAFFVLSLLERARGGRIGFDEYHHGEGAQAAQGAAAIFSGPIGVACALLMVIVMSALALNGRRLGSPVPAGQAAVVPSASAYVTAMGRLFARSRQRGPVAARFADELKHRVSGCTGIDSRLDDEAFLGAVRNASGAGEAEALEALLRRLRRLQAQDPDERQLLRVAREVDALERSFAGGNATP